MKVDLQRFCTLLRETQEDEYLDSSGVSPYLMDHLFHPYMAGEDIPLNSLDYDAFDLNDLDQLFDFLGDLSTVYNVLCGKAENLRKATPAARPTRAFC